jgi:hypothetical protein
MKTAQAASMLGTGTVQTEQPKLGSQSKPLLSQAPVAHTCNPSYSRGRDQEDQGSKPALANSSQDPISKIPNTKRVGGVAQGIGREFKLWYLKKNIINNAQYDNTMSLLYYIILYYIILYK